MGNNWKNIDWARRVEVPGVLYITLAHLAGNAFATAAMLTLAIGILSLQVAQFMPKPEHYALTPEITAFLAAAKHKKPAVEVTRPSPVEMTRSWWGSLEGSENWPLHEAALFGDVGSVAQLLEKGLNADLPMRDWHNTTPAAFGSFMGQLDATILLLQKGVDPYKAVIHPQFRSPTSVLQLLWGHAHTRPFAERLHALAMKASPPKG